MRYIITEESTDQILWYYVCEDTVNKSRIARFPYSNEGRIDAETFLNHKNMRSDFKRFEVTDTTHTWMWVRFVIPKEEMTKEVIEIKGRVARDTRYDLKGKEFINEWNAGYPIETSFIHGNRLEAPTHFDIHGVSFMPSMEALAKDVSSLTDNYMYQLSVLQKWYHQGPMRLYLNRWNEKDWPNPKPVSDISPWIDTWDMPLCLMPMMDLSIRLQGYPFKPKGDIDCVIGIVGDLVRSVQ